MSRETLAEVRAGQRYSTKCTKCKNLHKPLSDIWRKELIDTAFTPPQSRLLAYVQIAGQDIHRQDLFQPAQYITTQAKISVKVLLRLRTQHSEEIPTHQHLNRQDGHMVKSLYTDRRTCPLKTKSPSHWDPFPHQSGNSKEPRRNGSIEL